MLSLKFFSDEDIDARLISFLLENEIDIKFSEKGIRNSELYALACKENRGILSRDKDFLNTSLFSPLKLPLIMVIRIHPPELSKLKPLILNFIKNLSEDSLRKTWELREEGAFIVG
ncbi:DUF5615 family PIN-like protein [Candidatus Pacearchaeota archaeon]|nr:DUF5615 family PIN-like protein [Candidatus Pacearchaeota archaeon]